MHSSLLQKNAGPVISSLGSHIYKGKGNFGDKLSPNLHKIKYLLPLFIVLSFGFSLFILQIGDSGYLSMMGSAESSIQTSQEVLVYLDNSQPKNLHFSDESLNKFEDLNDNYLVKGIYFSVTFPSSYSQLNLDPSFDDISLQVLWSSPIGSGQVDLSYSSLLQDIRDCPLFSEDLYGTLETELTSVDQSLQESGEKTYDFLLSFSLLEICMGTTIKISSTTPGYVFSLDFFLSEDISLGFNEISCQS